MNGSQTRFAEAFQPPMSEKDRAIAAARRVLRGNESGAIDLFRADETQLVARQLLRALCLAEVG